jgi:hypothetical protein
LASVRIPRPVPGKEVDAVLVNDIIDAIEENLALIGNALGGMQRLTKQVDELKALTARLKPTDAEATTKDGEH